MSTAAHSVTPAGTPRDDAARRHLWGHFTRQSTWEHDVPTIVRGQGHHIWDDTGRRLIDGLSGLFVVQVGHGREELAERARAQASELAFFPLWSYAHPNAIDLAEVDYVVITAGGFDVLVEVVCEDDEHLLEGLNTKIRALPGVLATETFVYLKLRKQLYNWGTR